MFQLRAEEACRLNIIERRAICSCPINNSEMPFACELTIGPERGNYADNLWNAEDNAMA